MESWVRVLFLTILVIVLPGCAAFRGGPAPVSGPAETPEQVINPEVERREIKEPEIDSEDFEIGVFAGIMSVEDFGTNPVYGVRLAYHVSESFFVEGTFGRTDTEETSFERLSGAAELLADSEREFTYYNLALGYNILPGEVFLGSDRAYNTALYVIGGLGSTEFAGDNRFSVNLGLGYRMLVTDSVALHFDMRDLMFDIDVLGEEKIAHNLEAHLGFTVFF